MGPTTTTAAVETTVADTSPDTTVAVEGEVWTYTDSTGETFKVERDGRRIALGNHGAAGTDGGSCGDGFDVGGLWEEVDRAMSRLPLSRARRLRQQRLPWMKSRLVVEK